MLNSVHQASYFDTESGVLISRGKRIWYRSIPKNASTYMKSVMLRDVAALADIAYEPHGEFHVHVGDYPRYAFRSPPEADVRFVIIRDPVERFVCSVSYILSGTRGNITHRAETLQEVIDDFLEWNKRIYFRHHFAPQTYYCGHHPDVYTDLVAFPDVSKFAARLFPHSVHHSLNKFNSSDRERTAALERQLTPTIRDWIQTRYLEDYEFIDNANLWGDLLGRTIKLA